MKEEKYSTIHFEKSWNTQTYKRYLNNLYKIEELNGSEELDSLSEVFNAIRQNWDEQVMGYVKAYKTLVFDKQNRPLQSIYFEPNAPIDSDHIKALFDLIRNKIEGANSVVIFRNNATKPFMPDEQEKRIAASFRNYGKKVHIPVNDQFVVSSMGMYKFQHEDYLEPIL